MPRSLNASTQRCRLEVRKGGLPTLYFAIDRFEASGGKPPFTTSIILRDELDLERAAMTSILLCEELDLERAAMTSILLRVELDLEERR